MSFADELRQKQAEQTVKKISDEEVYQSILKDEYERLKATIRENVSSSKTITGEYQLNPYDCYLDVKNLEHNESSYHIVVSDDYGPKIQAKNLCEAKIKNGLVNVSVKASLTTMGKRLTSDLVMLGQRDGIKVWFTPRLWGTHCTKDISSFDQFEKVSSSYGMCAVIILHYEIHI